MTASFDGTSWGERGDGGAIFPVWSVEAIHAIKKIPGSDTVIVQVLGTKLPRLTTTAKCTAAQLSALRGKIGVTGSLVFGFETTTATLVSVGDPQEISKNRDVYFAQLSFIRSSKTFNTPSTSILLESSGSILLEDGTYLLLE